MKDKNGVVVKVTRVKYGSMSRRNELSSGPARETLLKFGFVGVVEDQSPSRYMIGEAPTNSPTKFFLELGSGGRMIRPFTLLCTGGQVSKEMDSGHTIYISGSTSSGQCEVTAFSGDYEWIFFCEPLEIGYAVPPRAVVTVVDEVDISSLPPPAERTKDNPKLLDLIISLACSQPECCDVNLTMLQKQKVKRPEAILARSAIIFLSCHVFGQYVNYVSLRLGLHSVNSTYDHLYKSKKQYVVDRRFREMVERLERLVRRKLRQ